MQARSNHASIKRKRCAMTDRNNRRLPGRFRRYPIDKRREQIESILGTDSPDFTCTGESEEMTSLADAMVEAAVGYMPIPLGIADGFLIDGRRYAIPMATEEPSVIAAASFAARIVASAGGFETGATDPVMTGEVFIPATELNIVDLLESHRNRFKKVIEESCRSLADRGGGYRGLEISAMRKPAGAKVSFFVDTGNAMGANIINTSAERLADEIEKSTGFSPLMSILTNEAQKRRAWARFALPVSYLLRGTDPGNGKAQSGEEIARRIIVAAQLAHHDARRAVTHNKGIMNGISALALATGNDTRGIEAAVHASAVREGQYRGLGEYRIEEETLIGTIDLPLPFAVVGGGVSFHPAARAALKILGVESSTGLSRIAAALGLAQNFAALRALVSSGIQAGHMGFHARRLAYAVGARGDELTLASERIRREGRYNRDTARLVLEQLRKEKSGR